MFGIIIIAVSLFLFLVLMIPVMLILLLLRRLNRPLSTRISQRIVSGMLRSMFLMSGSDIEIRGMENIPKDGAVLFVSNHRSYFDILAAYGYTPKVLGFVAKAEMLRYPLLKQWMELVNCLFLDRKDMKKGLKTILQGIEQVKSGISVWICPEGTRVRGKGILELEEFKEGSFKIAEKSGCPIVPVALSGTAEIFEKQMPRVRASHVVLQYGEPIYIEELKEEDRKRVGAYARGKILDMLESVSS